jgi:hypothetical protein
MSESPRPTQYHAFHWMRGETFDAVEF